jgi:hypothetical protein
MQSKKINKINKYLFLKIIDIILVYYNQYFQINFILMNL